MDNSAYPGNTRMARTRDAREWLAAYDRQQDGPVAIMLVGIRDLKQINDRHGRESGDQVLERTGRIIVEYARDSRLDIALVGRMPGREFLLAVRGNLSKASLLDAAAKLVSMLQAPSPGEDNNIPVSLRIAIAKSGKHDSGGELLYRATAALADAYGQTGTRIAYARAHAQDSRKIAQRLDTELHDAIAARAITVMLQPQFAVADGRLVGAEALGRWHHPILGEISAGQLFASADRCDLREELSQLLQEEAIRIAGRWPAACDGLRLSVNLGAGELQEGYQTALLDTLEKNGFPPERLTLELTEESLVRNLDKAAEQLSSLRRKGILIALDDFGTGYSSLAYLKNLPLDYLKLDKGMTPDITGKGRERIVLRAIIAMAQALDLKIIAEGVEKEEELNILNEEGCDFFQGFLKSPPLTSEEFEKFSLLNN